MDSLYLENVIYEVIEKLFRDKSLSIEVNTVEDSEDGKMLEISILNALGSNISSSYLSAKDLRNLIKK